jgi:hypothetical protein
MAPSVALDPQLLVACILIGLGTIFYLFFWNRLLAFLLSILLRVWGWKGDTSRIWVEFSE